MNITDLTKMLAFFFSCKVIYNMLESIILLATLTAQQGHCWMLYKTETNVPSLPDLLNRKNEMQRQA